MKTFLVLNSDQDGDGFEVEAETREEALEKALSEIGWYVVQDDPEDDEEFWFNRTACENKTCFYVAHVLHSHIRTSTQLL